jgi:predicted phage terminase large subunit-like protein
MQIPPKITPSANHELNEVEFDAVTRIYLWVFVQRVFAELCSEPFQNNFHVELLCGEIDRIRTEGRMRLCIAMPPRNLKSIIVTVALTAWLLGHDPTLRIICASYGQDLADKLAVDCRQVMQSAWYKRLFPATRLQPGRQSAANFQTTRGGGRLATSVGGVVTGMGADVIIIDDPMKPADANSDAERNRANEWIRHTMASRLDNKAVGSILIVMQRLHQDDTIGHVRNLVKFDLLSLPAIAQEAEEHIIRTPFGNMIHRRKEGEALHPERESLSVLHELKQMMGPSYFAAQYLQSPVPPGGYMVKSEWFRRYDANNPPGFDRVILSLDTASKANDLSDYSVCTAWGIIGQTIDQRRMYLLDVFREKLEYPDLKRKIIELVRHFKPSEVLIEDTSSGVQLIQELRHQGISNIRPIKPKGDKTMRFQAQTAAIEAGRIFIPYEAPYLAEFLAELEMFPRCTYKDQVDSVSQALAYATVPTPGDILMEFIQEDRHKMSLESGRCYVRGATPVIMLNHPDVTLEFHLTNGRVPFRDKQGRFYVLTRELDGAMSFPGVYQMSEGIL